MCDCRKRSGTEALPYLSYPAFSEVKSQAAEQDAIKAHAVCQYGGDFSDGIGVDGEDLLCLEIILRSEAREQGTLRR